MASAERYALALESINENLYDWDIVNDTVYFAPGLFKILGITPEEIRTPKDWTDRIHPADQPLFKYTLAEHLKGKAQVEGLLSGLITHAEVNRTATSTEVWRLARFWRDIMAY